MRISLKFIGGVLVGLGLASLAFGLWIWTMLHHMFVMGVSNWPGLVVMMLVPFLLILLGIALAVAGRQHREGSKP
jgi:hypothetical protein